MSALKSLPRALSVGGLTAVLTLGALPSALADPGDPAARSEEGRSARGLYVDDLEGGLPGLVESGSDATVSRRQTLVEAARTSELADETYGADAGGAADAGGEMTELADEISRQADLRSERADRLAAERAERERREAEERAAREAAERKAAEEKAAAEKAAEKAAREAREAKAEKAVDTALDQLGVPYRWGGTTPRGFDCSGLTSYVWRAAGVELPRTSRAQYRATKRISRDDLKPGDLLFFYSPVSHVGIYIGDGKMVDAPSRGRDVRVRSIFRGNFVGAGRPDY